MIAPTTAEDARYIADNLSEDEICRILHGGQEASRIAYECATTSILSWVICDRDGIPVAMFGADGERGEEYGSAWLFCTGEAKKSPRELAQGCAAGIAISRDYWPELRIEAEPRSEKQTRFLEFLGFRTRREERRGDEVWTELTL